MDRVVTGEDVDKNLNFIEKVIGLLTSDDEYKRALLNNQKTQTQLLSELAGVDLGDPVDPTNVDMDDLPKGLVGTTEDSIESGDRGRAIFDIAGSKYEGRVRASDDVQEGETIVITGGDNEARPADYASNALSKMAGGGEGGRNAVMSSRSISVYETSDLDHSNELGSVVIEPGEEEIIASVDEATLGGYLLGAGAYNGDNVEYTLMIDGEYAIGEQMNSPLGSLNEPFWFPESFGGVVKFADRVDYVARYPDSESGTVELTGRLFSQEL